MDYHRNRVTLKPSLVVPSKKFLAVILLQSLLFKIVVSVEVRHDVKPTIKVEVIDNTEKMFIHTPSAQQPQSNEIINTSLPLQFLGEKAIFWINKTVNGRIDTKLRLTCVAPYLTKWVINSHVKDGTEQEKLSSFISYQVTLLSRGNEHPLLDNGNRNHSDQNGNAVDYNTTELRINWFGPKFKSGFIDCVEGVDANDPATSSLGIFQRFDAMQKSIDVNHTVQHVEDPSIIPCRVHDPNLNPQLQRGIDYRILTEKMVQYDWKSGFRRVSKEKFGSGVAFACLLDGKEYSKYINTPKPRDNRVESNKAKIKDALSLTDERNLKISCFLKNFAAEGPVGINSVHLTQCAHPGYCSAEENPNSDASLHCTNLVRRCRSLSLALPSMTSSNGVQGKISCKGYVKGWTAELADIQDYYFVGISGKACLLSGFPPLSEIIKLDVIVNEDSNQITISCSVVKFLTFDPVRFSALYRNGTHMLLGQKFDNITLATESKVSGRDFMNNQAFRSKSATIELKHADGILGFTCHAPWYNSTEWISDSQNFSEHELGQIELAVLKSILGHDVVNRLLKLEVNQRIAGSRANVNLPKQRTLVCTAESIAFAETDIHAVLKEIKLQSCASPTDCGGHSRNKSNMVDIVNKCSLEAKSCEFDLPAGQGIENNQANQSLFDHGSFSCSAEIFQKSLTINQNYFTGISGKIHLISQTQSPQVEEIAQLSININKTSSEMMIVCTAVKFLTLPGIELSISYTNKTEKLFTNKHFGNESSNGSDPWTYVDGNKHTTTLKIPGSNTKGIESVNCHVPYYNSSQWIQISANPTAFNGRALPSKTTTQFKLNENINSSTQSAQNWSSQVNGHDDQFYLIFYDSHITLYSNKYLNSSSIENIKVISDAWQYTKIKYGPLTPTLDPSTLHIYLHTGKLDECRTSRTNSYVDNGYKNQTVIDCGKKIGDWSTLSDMQIIVRQIALLTLRMAKQTGSWPALEVAQWQMADIITYDIYNGLGLHEEAENWRDFNFEESQNFPRENTFWFKDWYFKIWTNYGNATVLNKFLELLHVYWHKKKSGFDYRENLEMGEYVYFWSGAAGVSLKPLATKAFGWTYKYSIKFRHAAEEFPNITFKGKVDGNGASDQNKSTALIVGISVSFVLIVITIVIITVILYRRRIKIIHKQMRELTAEEVKKFYEGNSTADKSSSSYGFIEAQPFNREYEIGRDQLDISHDKILGSGEFGLVSYGRIKSLPGSQILDNRVVAVKTVKPDVDVTYFMSLLTELKVMGFVGIHENIACLLGAVTANIKNREVFIALEFCANGDLLGFVQKNRSQFQDLFNKTKKMGATAAAAEIEIATTSFSTPEIKYQNQNSTTESNQQQAPIFSTTDLLDWSIQVADGMSFIAAKNVIHGDLAARNILLTADKVAKISDFGLSRQLQNYATYMKKSTTPLPWKWMAVESLRDMTFSVHSDVWAFGVTLFEIFSLGTLPYPGCNWTLEFVDELVKGLRLNPPEFGNDAVYDIMMGCMRLDPTERLAFLESKRLLEGIRRGIVSK